MFSIFIHEIDMTCWSFAQMHTGFPRQSFSIVVVIHIMLVFRQILVGFPNLLYCNFGCIRAS